MESRVSQTEKQKTQVSIVVSQWKPPKNRGKHVLRICFVKFLMFRKQNTKTGISKIVYGSLITLIFVLEKLVSRKLKIFNFGKLVFVYENMFRVQWNS